MPESGRSANCFRRRVRTVVREIVGVLQQVRTMRWVRVCDSMRELGTCRGTTTPRNSMIGERRPRVALDSADRRCPTGGWSCAPASDPPDRGFRRAGRGRRLPARRRAGRPRGRSARPSRVAPVAVELFERRVPASGFAVFVLEFLDGTVDVFHDVVEHRRRRRVERGGRVDDFRIDAHTCLEVAGPGSVRAARLALRYSAMRWSRSCGYLPRLTLYSSTRCCP